MRGPAPAVVVREYQPDAPGGAAGRVARRPRHRLARQPARRTSPRPRWGGAAAIVALGSSASAYAPDPPWIARECELLADADAGGLPVLGICFGAQALARGLGR